MACSLAGVPREARNDSQLYRDEPGRHRRIDRSRSALAVRDKILTTPTGSRVMRRDFGSAIPDLLDAPQNAVTRMQLMKPPLSRWRSGNPRISLTTVNVVFSETGAVTAELSGTITETMTETSNTIRLRS